MEGNNIVKFEGPHAQQRMLYIPEEKQKVAVFQLKGEKCSALSVVLKRRSLD